MAYTLVGNRDDSDGNPQAINFTFNAANMGTISNENVSKEANLTPLPMMTQDSDETQVFDFGGVTRSITISVVKNDTPANLKNNIITELNKLINGYQDSVLVYTSTLLGAINVKVSRVNVTYVGGNIRTLAYTIQLIESDVIG